MIYGMSPPIPVWTHSDDMSADPADPQKHLYDVDNGERSYRDIALVGPVLKLASQMIQ